MIRPTSPARKHLLLYLPALILLFLTLPACRTTRPAGTATSEHWPNGVAYEIFVQSFADSDGDKIGDFKGATDRLDYLQDLGVRAVWLMPIGPSPSYHKYDVTDYRGIHPDYGTIDDFKTFVREAHRRNIAVIMDLVVNHTSNEHPWFKAAVADPNSPYHDYYVWASPEKVAAMGATKETSGDSDNRQAWHEVSGSKDLFYAYFGGHMPDLNFDSPAVRREIKDIGRFWLQDVGVDGFRLDAAKHIFPDDRAKDSHAWWIEFRQAMQAAKPDVYLVGEVWDRADVVAPYLKGLTALFNFDLGGAISQAAREERADSLAYRLKRIRDFYQSIDPNFHDATFITNHDQNRIMSVVGGDQNKARMAAALLLTLPGSPYLYYGEEIGMTGMKPDEHIREPFQWGGALESKEARWVAPQYSTEQAIRSAADQDKDPNSLLNYYRRLIDLRNESAVLTRGNLTPVDGAPDGAVSFLRTLSSDTLWVVHNLSGSVREVAIPAELRDYDDITFRTDSNVHRAGDRIVLPPYSTAVFGR